MNRLNFEEDNYEFIDDTGDAEVVMEHAMGFLWEFIIKPNKEQLDEDEKNMLGVVGLALKTIAQKAKAYEDMYEKGKNNENYLN